MSTEVSHQNAASVGVLHTAEEWENLSGRYYLFNFTIFWSRAVQNSFR